MGLARHLGPGQFLGEVTRSHAEAGLVVAARLGTVVAADVRRHDHDAAHVVFAPRGYVTSAAGARPGAPALVVNPPDTRHRDRFEAVPAGFLAITIEPAVWARLTEGAAVAGPWTSHAPRAHALAAAVYTAAEQRGGLVRSLTWQLLAEVLPLAIDPAPIAEARARILDEPGRAWSIEALARAVGVHPVYLARGFRRAYGTSPSGLGRGLRVAAAARAISAGASPGEAAHAHGFADQSHLTRWMTRLLGVTPGRLVRARRPGQVRSVQDVRR